MAFISSTVSVGDSTKKSHFDQLLNNTIALKSETVDINGEKTFKSATTFELTATYQSTVKLSAITARTATSGIAIDGVSMNDGSGTATFTINRLILSTASCSTCQVGDMWFQYESV